MTGHNQVPKSSHADNQRRLLIAQGITGTITVAELVGGLLSHNLALISELRD